MNILFFVSTTDSVTVLDALYTFVSKKHPQDFSIVCVVTQTPAKIGRKQILTPTPVEIWAKQHEITISTFENRTDKPWLYEQEQSVIDTLTTCKPDLLLSASYGQKIPHDLIAAAQFGGINVHPSLLPAWRGAYPVPWSILMGESQTGVTLITLSDKFDEGKIIAQKKIPLSRHAMAEDIKKQLFTLGAELLVSTLTAYINGTEKGKSQRGENATVARKIKREDGFIPWNHLLAGLEGEDIQREFRQGLLKSIIAPIPMAIDRMYRALSPWPGVWTIVENEASPLHNKRVKILLENYTDNGIQIESIQIEGRNPVSWKQFTEVYLQ
jgi:methionyl-tRNA formyltransferase